MATDVDVQYFSHLNGLTLGNNWGDLIRLLDTCLVNGLPLTSITSASIDAQGDITINLYAAHKAMLFQIIELTGFTPSELNGKYRIKGLPSANQLILKATHIGKTITTTGTAKLASLGYEIIFRDTNDIKRVYRAKNPAAEHPFIRVDESLTSPDGATGVYASTYAKYAMVGLLEHMNHIDDYENPSVLQLPFMPSNPKMNWNIYNGSGSDVIRGWSRWYWRRAESWGTGAVDTSGPSTGNASFTLMGDLNAFYFLPSLTPSTPRDLALYGTGIFDSAIDGSIIHPWFLMSTLAYGQPAATSQTMWSKSGGLALTYDQNSASFIAPAFNEITPLSGHAIAHAIMPDYQSGSSALALVPYMDVNLTIPFRDSASRLRGVLPHVLYNAGASLASITTPAIRVTGNNGYMIVPAYHPSHARSGFAFYLGEI